MRHEHDDGFTLVELLVVLGIIALLVGLLMPTLGRTIERANRIKCASNLRVLGQALHIYATQNQGHYPRTFCDLEGIPGDGGAGDGINPGLGTRNRGADLTVPDANGDPFTINATYPSSPTGSGSVTASMFLLVRTRLVTPGIFICPSTSAVADTFGGKDVSTRGNFTGVGPEPTGRIVPNCSYGYSNPFPPRIFLDYTYMTDRMKPGFAVMADMGPGGRSVQSDVYHTRKVNDSSSQQAFMNSPNHQREGQNVLFADGHVDFAATVFVGINYNHIYVGDTEVGTNDSDPMVRAWVTDDPKTVNFFSKSDNFQLTMSAEDSVILPYEHNQ